VVPQRIVELSSYHTMVGCAASGMGVALVPESLLAHLSESTGVSRHRLPAPIARAQTLLIRLKGRHHPGVEALLNSLNDASKDSGKDKPRQHGRRLKA
jgi:DNA-binding transcriptional LysR family regulator